MAAGLLEDYSQSVLVEIGSASKELGCAPVMRTAKRSPTFVAELIMETGWLPGVRPVAVFFLR